MHLSLFFSYPSLSLSLYPLLSVISFFPLSSLYQPSLIPPIFLYFRFSLSLFLPLLSLSSLLPRSLSFPSSLISLGAFSSHSVLRLTSPSLLSFFPSRLSSLSPSSALILISLFSATFLSLFSLSLSFSKIPLSLSFLSVLCLFSVSVSLSLSLSKYVCPD